MNTQSVGLLELVIETSWQVNGLLGAEFQGSRPADSLTVGHLRIMRGLTEGPLSMTRISRVAGVTRGTATGMVDRLVASGMVERYDDPTNRRVVLVRLTKKGNGFFDKMHERAIACVRPLIGDMNESERQELERLLKKLTSSMVAKDEASDLAAAS